MTDKQHDAQDGAGPDVRPETASQPQPYRESDDHVPDPTAVSGTLDTSGTSGGQNDTLRSVTGIFGNSEDHAERLEAAINARISGVNPDTTNAGNVVEAPVQDEDGGYRGIGDAPGTAPATPPNQRQAGTADTSTEDATPTAAGDKSPDAERAARILQSAMDHQKEDEAKRSASSRTSSRTAPAKGAAAKRGTESKPDSAK